MRVGRKLAGLPFGDRLATDAIPLGESNVFLLAQLDRSTDPWRRRRTGVCLRLCRSASFSHHSLLRRIASQRHHALKALMRFVRPAGKAAPPHHLQCERRDPRADKASLARGRVVAAGGPEAKVTILSFYAGFGRAEVWQSNRRGAASQSRFAALQISWLPPQDETGVWSSARAPERPACRRNLHVILLNLAGSGSRSRAPGPPRLASMNSTPAASKHRLTTASVARRG